MSQQVLVTAGVLRSSVLFFSKEFIMLMKLFTPWPYYEVIYLLRIWSRFSVERNVSVNQDKCLKGLSWYLLTGWRESSRDDQSLSSLCMTVGLSQRVLYPSECETNGKHESYSSYHSEFCRKMLHDNEKHRKLPNDVEYCRLMSNSRE